MYSPAYPLWSIPEESVAAIRSALGEEWEVRSLEVELHASGDGAPEVPEALLREIETAEVYCGFGIRREAFRAARRLRWVHSGAAGVSGSLFPEMRESDVLFTNSAGIHAEPMAEHAIAMMLYFARGLDVAVGGMRAREWRHATLAAASGPSVELAGKTIGIVGYGSIGSAIGRRAAALGLKVRAIRRTPGALPRELEWMGGPADLPALLARSEYLALTVPETASTRKLIGAAELAQLPAGAVLLNLSRGALLDEEALLEALLERRLRGAGLDVFRQEPLPADHPLWGLENVLITPHVGGNSSRFWKRETELIVRNVRRYVAGEPLENLVDKELGY